MDGHREKEEGGGEKEDRILTFVEVFFFPRRPLYFNARYYRF